MTDDGSPRLPFHLDALFEEALLRPFGVACSTCGGARSRRSCLHPTDCDPCTYLREGDSKEQMQQRDALREERVRNAPRPGVGEWKGPR